MVFDTNGLEVLALGITLGLAAYAAIRLNRSHARIGDRARAVARSVGTTANTLTEAEAPSLRDQFSHSLAALANRLPLFNHKQRQQIVVLLQSVGLRHPRALPLFIAIKLSSGGIGALGGALGNRLIGDEIGVLVATLLVLTGLQLGLMLPEFVLHMWAKRRRRTIHRGLPDALDLLVICTNAGYSLPASIKRITDELWVLCPPLADELELTSRDIQLSADPVIALRSLADRVKVDSLRAVVTTLIQAQQYGTPITHSLKTLAKTERATRMLKLEEKGAKLAAKLTLPMMLLIMPAVILIAGGPALMNLTEALK